MKTSIKDLNLTTRNAGIETLDNTIAEAKNDKEINLGKTVVAIHSKLQELQDNDEMVQGLSFKKSMKHVQATIFGDLMVAKQTKKGSDYLVSGANKSINKAYNIAFTSIFREMKINFNLISVAQANNLVSYGTKNRVNDLMQYKGEEYTEEVVVYLKELKTREVTSMTYEKKQKL